MRNSLISWQRARHVVNNEQWNLRASICRQCQFWQELGNSQVARCKKCGCSSGKLLLATSSCPLNPPKWGPQPHIKKTLFIIFYKLKVINLYIYVK